MPGRKKGKAKAPHDIDIDRARKDLDLEEYIDKLKEILENSTDWWRDLTRKRDGKGVGAAQHSMSRALDELARLKEWNERGVFGKKEKKEFDINIRFLEPKEGDNGNKSGD